MPSIKTQLEQDMIEVLKFKTHHIMLPRQSKIDPFKAKILALRRKDKSYAEIASWLKRKGVSITSRAVGTRVKMWSKDSEK